MRKKLKRVTVFLLVALLVIPVMPSEMVSAAAARATTMKMDSYTGKVTIHTLNGTSRKVSKGMRLLNGYEIGTKAESTAFINLDDAKAVKLDENTQIQVRQKGKQLELMAESGNLFFNVKKPLEADESFRVRSSTMVTGVRGTSAYITIDKDNTCVYLLEGTLELNQRNPETGTMETVSIQGGEVAVTCKDASNNVSVSTEKFTEGEVPYFVLEEIAKDSELQQKIEEKSTLSVEKLNTVKECMDQGMTQEEAAAKVEETKAETPAISGGGESGGYYPPAAPEEAPSTPPAEEEEGGDENDFLLEKYSENTADGQTRNVARVQGLTEEGKLKTDIVIPRMTSDGYTITEIDSYAFCENSSITSVRFPSSIERIGDEAFFLCSQLTEITVPANVEYIGDYAFCGCHGVSTVSVLSNKVQFGEGVFQECSDLTSVTLTDGIQTIGSRMFFLCQSLPTIELPASVTEIGTSAFSGCNQFTEITLPESVKTVKSYAFSECEGLKTIDLKNAASIENNAFYLCKQLETVRFSEEVEGLELGVGVFQACGNLSNVGLPKGLVRISDRTFFQCKALTSINIPSGVESIGNSAFCASGLVSIHISDGVTTIEAYAFSECASLDTVSLPNSITAIDKSAFGMCADNIKFTYQDNVYDSIDAVLEIMNGSN